ncbi:hypothetical protein CMV24_14335 [Pseudomonas plecoglossicida]|uniref:Uncharacterized protein n=1 Tax=Pseudomonas plecoglossicida TaxID=70775 RepID=A0A2A3M4A6_PSEDL|nr:hypothetical protein CMV24_14335 [Pseudomonas plecoglossicida]
MCLVELQARRTQYASGPRTVWERACPRRVQRGAWHRLRRCSRARPLPQSPAKSMSYVLFWRACPRSRRRGA